MFQQQTPINSLYFTWNFALFWTLQLILYNFYMQSIYILIYTIKYCNCKHNGILVSRTVLNLFPGYAHVLVSTKLHLGPKLLLYSPRKGVLLVRHLVDISRVEDGLLVYRPLKRAVGSLEEEKQYGRAVIDTPHIDVPTIAVNRWLQFCYLDALIDASRWQKKKN